MELDYAPVRRQRGWFRAFVGFRTFVVVLLALFGLASIAGRLLANDVWAKLGDLPGMSIPTPYGRRGLSVGISWYGGRYHVSCLAVRRLPSPATPAPREARAVRYGPFGYDVHRFGIDGQFAMTDVDVSADAGKVGLLALSLAGLIGWVGRVRRRRATVIDDDGGRT